MMRILTNLISFILLRKSDQLSLKENKIKRIKCEDSNDYFVYLCKENEKIWQGVRSRKLLSDIQEMALRKLRQLEVSANRFFDSFTVKPNFSCTRAIILNSLYDIGTNPRATKAFYYIEYAICY
jgi:hypothetical protein